MYLSTHTYIHTYIQTYIYIYTCLCIHARLNPHPKIQFSSFISRFIAMLTICHLPSATDQKRTSRRELRSLCFCEFSTWAMHKIDNPYRVSVFSLKNHHPFSMVFAWLWGYEFAVLPMFSIHVQHTRLKKNGLFCLSTWRPSQPASSTCLRCPSLCDKQTQTRSLGWIHSHLEWAYACCTAPWVYFF